ncbi:UDP-N-acetylmuramoyl-tripeptide--D-alanyl-D-alanine ligase [Nostocoides japonicum T1-X7]|uniref:UDP-N-acetylmuramoyl-tripeptide--D-alanyl-D-alanine ligase n=1 Tax=Nostocoides japonicum T1-X7 TaxID=1194083 RepID=A0A077M7S8_9MICO|nr:UDP-N-acetylmuramoyl-tripeptide--D-alanyl-D-alanine ligase [Tetrasphaera japonica]CCH80110.1 UDP-N-acetylmuramoyl-tripeptide--D-alanyl-D-alanine ligase [Tetrasphaera japonica T1-X7]
MIPLSLAEIGALTGGVLHGIPAPEADRLVVDGPVVTDSREAGPGSLYVARIGEHADGHRFVGPARDNGAVAALTSRPVEDLPCVVVDDVQAAFVALARGIVDRCPDLTVVGVTGSSGKTSTKDLLGSVLATAGETVAPVGSLNSEVGVPLTVCRVTPTTRFLVVEMGARGIGHIRYLTGVAPPRIGVVLNVGTAHVGEFGSREAIAVAKAELVQALPGDGVAVLNADDPVVRAMAGRTAARVVLVGLAEDAEIRAVDVTVDAGGRPSFRLVTPAGEAPVSLGLVGRHHVGNALAVVAVALECGVGLDAVADALGAATPVSRWRMEVTTRPDGVTVVNDAYNANPDSMRAALAALADLAVTGRRWAVLGTMLELGEESDADHAEVGREAVRRGVDRLVVVGETARPMADAAREATTAGTTGPPTQVSFVADSDAAYDLIAGDLRDGDAVLLKSSRDAGLRWLGDRIAGRTEETAVAGGPGEAGA